MIGNLYIKNSISFFFVLIFCRITFATDYENYKEITSLLSDRSMTSKAGIVDMTKNQICAFNEYFDIVRPHKYLTVKHDNAVGAENTGFQNMMAEKYKASKCFRVALDKLYKEVDKADSDTDPARRTLLTRDGSARFNVSVSDIRNEKYKSGWLLDKAKEIAGGDPLFALQLIGFCGHDDVYQVEYNREAEATNIPMQCPAKSSLMYFNGSFDRINPEVENKGVRSSASGAHAVLTETRGITNQTPAKNYHVMAGAYIGCRIAEKCQISTDEISQLQRKFGLLYRAVRQKLTVDKIWSEYKIEFARYQNDLNGKKIPSNKMPIEVLENYVKEKFLKSTASNGLSTEQVNSKVKEKTNILLAAYFYKFEASELSKNILGYIDFKAPRDALSYDHKEPSFRNFVRPNSPEFEKKCRDLAQERCDETKKTLDSWNADFIWTANQHSVGGIIGAAMCEKSKEARAGGVPSVCSRYEAQADITASNVAQRYVSSSKKDGPASIKPATNKN